MKPEDLKYKIEKRTPSVSPDGSPLDIVYVTWTTPLGFQHYKHVPITHPPAIVYEVQHDSKVDVLFDSIFVKAGTPDSIVMQMLEEKKPKLIENFTPPLPLGTKFTQDGRDIKVVKN